MRPTLKVNTMNLKHPKSVLLGTSALVCFALSAPVVADDFVITGSDNSTNGTGTTNGATAAAIADNAINGSDTVSLGTVGLEHFMTAATMELKLLEHAKRQCTAIFDHDYLSLKKTVTLT